MDTGVVRHEVVGIACRSLVRTRNRMPPTPAVAAEDSRRPYLDGLRGCAACVVLFAHLAIALNSPLLGIFNGNAAVCVFFVLSGYVLTDLSQRSELTFPAQALRRYVRLVGPILITSTFAWALLALGLYRNQQAAAALNNWWLGSWYKFDGSFPGMLAETFYGVFISGQSIYNCNLWTMRPELIGSLYLFVINATAPSRGLRVVCYVALALFHIADYMPLFPVGALLYEFHPELARLARRLRDNMPALALTAFPLVVAIGLGLCLVQGSAGGVLAKLLGLISDLMARDADRYWHMLGATIVVAATLHWPFAQTILGSRAGRFLGKISFVLYLIQVPIICSLTSWLFLALAPISVSIAAKIAACSTIVVIFAASAATCWFVDQVPTRLSRAAGRSLDALFRLVPPRHSLDPAEPVAARLAVGA
jgi:peptidoglycan/LPS O-acetylase OafA/YrhL